MDNELVKRLLYDAGEGFNEGLDFFGGCNKGWAHGDGIASNADQNTVLDAALQHLHTA